MLQGALQDAEKEQKELEGRMAKVVASEVVAKRNLEETLKKLEEAQVGGIMRNMYKLGLVWVYGVDGVIMGGHDAPKLECVLPTPQASLKEVKQASSLLTLRTQELESEIRARDRWDGMRSFTPAPSSRPDSWVPSVFKLNLFHTQSFDVYLGQSIKCH